MYPSVPTIIYSKTYFYNTSMIEQSMLLYNDQLVVLPIDIEEFICLAEKIKSSAVLIGLYFTK